jgi:hypothetical protein
MRSAELCAIAIALLAGLAARAESEASRRERQRRELQDRLGIVPGPPPPDAGIAPALVEPSPIAAPGPKVGAPPGPARPRALTFVDDAAPVLQRRCGSCHRPGDKAGATRWVLRGEVRADHEVTLRFVELKTPAQSPLLRKANGTLLHGAGKVLEAASAEHGTLLRWIEEGAPLGRAGGAGAIASSPNAELGSIAPPATAPQPDAQPTSPPASAPQPLAQPLAPGTSLDSPAANGTSAAPAPRKRHEIAFTPRVHEALRASCSACHAQGKLAGATRYLISDDPRQHFEAARALVIPGDPAASPLHAKARGEAHAPGAVWPPGSPELALLAEWIDRGAPAEEAAPPAAVPAAAPGLTPPHRAGITLASHPLLGSLQLNGRFDLNYERTTYSDHPFQPGAQNALRSYHHFLFLSRQSAHDPVTLSVELLTLQLWELNVRLPGEGWPIQVSAKLGKVLVPFGGEPLFHHSYGGHAGFDQRVLPPVFAREGISANVQGRWRSVSLSGDLYLIAGYALKRADAVLNLQSDFAPLDQARLGVGARLGAAWGPISVWYSPYFNSLGFGRRLFLQAIDVAVWRPRGIPVLERFSLGAGLLRGDISGGAAEGYGGEGEDYYHFASYLQLRWYPTEWLHVQYRQGLRTFNNRRGLFLDSSRLTRDDGSTHNVGVVARWRGLSVGLYHFWNLEKVDEAPDDFTRLGVALDF